MSFVVVGEVDEEVLCGHQLHDRVSQELHPLVVAAGREGRRKKGMHKQRQGWGELFTTVQFLLFSFRSQMSF